jgi:hypothetical protein
MKVASKKLKIKKEYLIYLDNLKESGIVNMFGAADYLRRAYPKLGIHEASAILVHWMKTYSERHPREVKNGNAVKA